MNVTGNYVSILLFSITTLVGCSDSGVTVAETGQVSKMDLSLRSTIEATVYGGADSLIIPDSDDFTRIPQDASNPLSRSKVSLGQMLFHDTAMAINTGSMNKTSWSCATCHHADAGFKAGIPQGIGEGGSGFGVDGSDRVLAAGFDADATLESGSQPDIQPIATPTVLNSAYQDVMLWNGQFGNSPGSVNTNVDTARLTTLDTPKAENLRLLSGIETQAIAGLVVHRLDLDEQDIFNKYESYENLFTAAFGSTSTDDYQRDAGLAIAAFERTILANEAPFQRWLKGDSAAMSDSLLRGATLFFGTAGCSECHKGPALSSLPNAAEDELFFSIGMNDLDVSDERVHGTVAHVDKLGRGGLTGRVQDRYKFKIPQLYNLSDSATLGHGASFTSIEDVIRYKNNAIAQNPASQDYLDIRFVPLNLSDRDIDDLTSFLTDGLHDPNLKRYTPSSVPSGACVTAGLIEEGC